MRLTICRGYGRERCRELVRTTRCPRHAEMARRARNQRRNATSTYHSPAWRRASREARARDGACLLCGSTHELQAHHITDQRFGGEDAAWNAMTVCDPCHRELEADLHTGRETSLVHKARAIGVGIQALYRR